MMCAGFSNIAGSAAYAAGNQPVVSLDAIVVSGEKQERSLKRTTSSVSVIGNEELRTTQNQTLRDAISDTPNVITQTGVVPSIRGVDGNGAAGGFNSISGGAKPRVSVLTDGVTEPFVADFTGDLGLWDVEQVEVYRGPQSTNNGRNSIGGAIYIKTKDPTFDWEGAVRVGYRNQENYWDKAVMLSGPIVEDKLAFRFYGQMLDAETVTNDQEFATNPADYDLNEVTSERYRGKLLWKLTEDLDALLTFSKNTEQGDAGRTYYTADDPWAYNRLFFRNMDTASETTSLKLGYRFNNRTSIDVIAASMDYKFGFNSYTADPADEQYLVFDETNKSLDAKLNFGEGNRQLNGHIGLAFFERDQDVNSTGAVLYNGDDSSDSQAVYGEVNYALSDRWIVTGGGRVEHESQRRDFTYGVISETLDESNTIVLPKIAFQYDWSEQTTIGFSARKGYNSAGGALSVAASEYYYYDEETVNTFEVSVRSSLAGDTINLRGNLFYNDYDGYQALSSTRRIVNMNDVATYGAELEASAWVTPDLQLTTGLGLLHTEIKDAGAGYASATGNELNSAPSFTANLGGTYYPSDALSISAAVNYIDDYYGDLENTAERKVDGYAIAKLSADYETDDWLLSAYINNLTDEKAYRVVEPPSARYPSGYVDVVERRNVGVSVTYSF
jgi:outer membrane receptor protein involved in Fe transport